MGVRPEDAPRRVLYLGPLLTSTGAAFVMRQVLNRLDRRRFAPEVVLRDHAVADHGFAPDVVLHRPRVAGRKRLLRAARRVGFAAWLRRLVRDRRYHAIIVDLRTFAYGLLLLDWILPLRVPIVARWGAIASAHPRLPPPIERRVVPFMLRRAAAVVVPAELGRRDLVENFGVDASRIHVVGNMVDLESISAAARERDIDRRGVRPILFVGSLSRRKDPELVLEGFIRIAARHPEAVLWLVGDGPLASALADTARRHDVEDRVVFWGWQANPYPFFAAADVLVHTSRADGFSLTLLEAVAFRLPPLYADRPVGLIEELRRARIGAAFADADELGLLLDDVLRAGSRLDDRQAADFVARFSPAAFIAGYERVLDGLPAPSSAVPAGGAK